MQLKSNNTFVNFIFYGNYFYGICTLALCIEASLQQKLPLNSLLFYVLVFSSTVVYYTKAYMTDISVDTINKRTQWYNQNRKTVKISQAIFISITVGALLYSLSLYYKHLLQFSAGNWFFILIFPLVAGLYYGFNSKVFGKYNLRSKGSLKPFIIGFTWAGFVTIYPALYHCLEKGINFDPDKLSMFLFLKNFLFITILCIMFDIKDYASDFNHNINTFVVKAGLRKTIFYIIIPLTVLGLVTFFIFVTFEHFHTTRILINSLPFMLLLLVGYSLRLRRTTLYYLVVVDGMMLIKALCGICAMLQDYSL